MSAPPHSPRQRDVREDLLHAAFDQWSARVNGFVLARCGDPGLAADVTSDVFVAAARAVAGPNPEQVTLPWLIATARRRLIDQWRLQRTRRKTLQSIVAEPRIDDERPAIDTDRVQRALAALPPNQVAALSMRYLDDMSVSEVADELELSYRAAESLLSRARRSFERAWEGT